MPNRSMLYMSQTLPATAPCGTTESPKVSPVEPVPPLWLSLLTGVSRWLNRVFLGLVLALVGFTLWNWWQG